MSFKDPDKLKKKKPKSAAPSAKPMVGAKKRPAKDSKSK